MKKVILLFLTCILVISVFPTISDATENRAIVTQKEIGVTTEVVELSEEEYIEVVSKHTNMSVEQVKAKLNMNKKIFIQSNILNKNDMISPTSSGYRYLQAITTKDFSPNSIFKTKVELGIAYTQYYSTSFRQINSIDASWTGAAGSGLYEWKQYTKYTYPKKFPTSKAEAHARGAVETKINTSISGNMSIKNQLIRSGFDVTLQVGSTYHLRKVDNLNLYIRSY